MLRPRTELIFPLAAPALHIRNAALGASQRKGALHSACVP